MGSELATTHQLTYVIGVLIKKLYSNNLLLYAFLFKFSDIHSHVFATKCVFLFLKLFARCLNKSLSLKSFKLLKASLAKFSFYFARFWNYFARLSPLNSESSTSLGLLYKKRNFLFEILMKKV